MTGKLGPVGEPFALDVGCGESPDPRASVCIDAMPYGRATARASVLHLPFADSVFTLATAHQVLEHVPTGGGTSDPFFTACDEVWRVLAPGGTFEFDVPHVLGPYAFSDPTHRRFFNPHSLSWLWGHPESLARRKRWELVSLQVRRCFPGGGFVNYFLRERLPRVGAVLDTCRVGRPALIFVVLRKPLASDERT